jgi:hypothetical protein
VKEKGKKMREPAISGALAPMVKQLASPSSLPHHLSTRLKMFYQHELLDVVGLVKQVSPTLALIELNKWRRRYLVIREREGSDSIAAASPILVTETKIECCVGGARKAREFAASSFTTIERQSRTGAADGV